MVASVSERRFQALWKTRLVVATTDSNSTFNYMKHPKSYGDDISIYDGVQDPEGRSSTEMSLGRYRDHSEADFFVPHRRVGLLCGADCRYHK